MLIKNPDSINMKSDRKVAIKQIIDYCDLHLDKGDTLEINPLSVWGYYIRIHKDPDFVRGNHDRESEFNLVRIEVFSLYDNWKDKLVASSDDICIADAEFEQALGMIFERFA